MTAFEVAPQIEKLQAQIEQNEADLARKINRLAEISARTAANAEAKKRIVTRYKLEIKELTDELNNQKAKLWGLQEINLPQV